MLFQIITCGTSTVVEHFTLSHQVKGSNPPTSTVRKKMSKKFDLNSEENKINGLPWTWKKVVNTK